MDTAAVVPDATSGEELQPVRALRRSIRAGTFSGSTAGQAGGFMQANLVILPEDQAFDFMRFCQANPRPCPLLAVSEPGDPTLPGLGAAIDIRTDVPGYRIFHNGKAVEERTEITELWRNDLVTFALGCSFSFEQALLAEGIPLHHINEGRNVAMYRTAVQTVPAGLFAGQMVVSMRALQPADAIRAIQICARFPAAHGAPVHIGVPEAIGVTDLARPDFGEVPTIREGELPLFWACGVTPQVALEAARLPFAITHSPGKMLVTDVPSARLMTI